MHLPPNINPENDSIKKAFITTSIALYLQACHLQYEEEADAVMLSFLIANANAGQPNDPAGKQPGSGNAGNGNPGNSGDDDDSDDSNLGSSLVNNTGQITSDSDFLGAGNIDVPRKEKEASGQAEAEAEGDEEQYAVTSPGGTGDTRIIGGVNPENDEIDWTGSVDEGTKDADAATG